MPLVLKCHDHSIVIAYASVFYKELLFIFKDCVEKSAETLLSVKPYTRLRILTIRLC